MHQHLDRLAHLIAELVSDLLRILGAGVQQRGQRLALGHAEAPVCAEQRPKRAQRQWFFQPDRGVPRDKRRRLTRTRIHQHPALAVRQQPERHTARAQQFGHARRRRRGPARTPQWLFEILRGRQHLHQQRGRAASQAQHQIRAQRLTVFGDLGHERRIDLGTAGNHVGGIAQHLAQHKAHPGGVDRAIRAQALLVIRPLVVRRAQRMTEIGIVRVEPLRECIKEDFDAQEWP